MSNLLKTIQKIAVQAVNATNPVTFYIGTVASEKPLSIRLHNTTLEVGEDFLVMTDAVVEKKITIDQHDHAIGSSLTNHTHVLSGSCSTGPISGTATQSPDLGGAKVDPTTLSGSCTEHGDDLPVEQKDNKLVITYNRGLKKDDKVLMLKVSNGQQFVILSRVFPFK